MTIKENLGILLRCVHFSLPIYMFIILALGNKFWVKLMIVFFVCMIVMYLVLQDCILAIIEQKLLNDNVSNVDMLIEIVGGEINTRNRHIAVFISLFHMWLLIGFIVYYRLEFIL